MNLPLEGIKVLEFTHAVMGPSCGLLMADMGADVTHIEPPKGDHTRTLKGFGTGFFSMYNRNKKSLAIDLKAKEGKNIIYKLVKEADIVVENFGPGTMSRLGYGYETLEPMNDRLIYCSLKGFMDGPYEKRHAMDEVVQMMGGLAYMTGRPGDPLRAGTSVIDITGGMFGYIGVLQALYEREKTGKGKFVKAGLFETCAFLMGQHMAYAAQIDFDVPPMPGRVSAWSIYQIFKTKDKDSVFVGIISEKHWERFCKEFGWEEWLGDERLATNNGRIDERKWFLPELEKRIKAFSKAEIISNCERAGIPFAPIAQPEDLFDDPQLNEGDQLLEVKMRDGKMAKLPKTPLEYGDSSITKRLEVPEVGEHSGVILKEMGFSEAEIQTLRDQSIIG